MSGQGYFGAYRGVCTSNADPEKRQRIRAKVPQLLGEHETDWAWPCVPPDQHGNALPGVPRPGQGVWITFEGGDVTKPSWTGVWNAAPKAEAVGEHTDADHADAFVSKAGGDTITASGAAVTPLVVKGAAAQTANLFEARNDAGTLLAQVTKDGAVVSTPGFFAGGTIQNISTNDPGMFLRSDAAASRPLIVRGAASQTANLAEFQNSAGTVLTMVEASGRLRWGVGYQNLHRIDSNADFNADMVSGQYELVSAGGPLNAPATGSDWWFLLHWRHGNSDQYVRQVAYRLTAADSTEWRRHKNAGTWSAWTAH